MENISKDLGIPANNILPTASSNLFTVVVHNRWLKRLLKNQEVDDLDNNIDFPLQISEIVPYPWRKVFIRVLKKQPSKVLPLPRHKLSEANTESPLTFSQLLQYVSQNNHRNLWKESNKKYSQNNERQKENTFVNLMEHDQLLSEVILRLYGCNIIRIKSDNSGKLLEYKEIPNKYILQSYETHFNLSSAMFTFETDANFFIVYHGHSEYTLLDCLNFSPALVDKNYGRGLFLLYQILNALKAVNDRGLCLGTITLQDIYISENLWLQIMPPITNNLHIMDVSQIYEHKKTKSNNQGIVNSQRLTLDREVGVKLETLCFLWVRGRISNLDYLLHLNALAGRSMSDPQAHCVVPWVTDFSSRCGRNWRDLTKSKYRLNKGDRQLELTYDTGGQTPHHVTDPLADITCYVYLARRTPKEVLCAHVRSRWVPAEYPASVQRLQQWSPDECVPEFYCDPTVFRSIHEDLPDLGIPSWATCVEDFVSRHREALEGARVSEQLHHWIDLVFGYKLSGAAAIKAKNVCLSLVDGHAAAARGPPVQLLAAPHPARCARAAHAPPPPPRRAANEHKNPSKPNDSSEDASDDETETSPPPHAAPRAPRPARAPRAARGPRARSLSRGVDGPEPAPGRASSHSRHHRACPDPAPGVIALPKDFNPVAQLLALESLDSFSGKCFFAKLPQEREDALSYVEPKCEGGREENAFTNHMFLASYEQDYLKRFTQDAGLDGALKDRKGRAARHTTDAAVYKRRVTEGRRQDMLNVGCLIVEIFLHVYMRPLRTDAADFLDRYNTCRRVLKYNFNSLPKCVSYVASLLLRVEPARPSVDDAITTRDELLKKMVITDKGLPWPTAAQLLQPLLAQHLVPFPASFAPLYRLLGALHEYSLAAAELGVLHAHSCDGAACERYRAADRARAALARRLADGRVQACAAHLDALLAPAAAHQFDALDIFLPHYLELLRRADTAVPAAWYLFDAVSRALGPAETRRRLLRPVLALYEDDEDAARADARSEPPDRHKLVKLYHNIFLLQLMVRFGLRCFLDNFTAHLVEAVGGYKDAGAESPAHECHARPVARRRRREDDRADIFSPDTSDGSERARPDAPDADNKSESEIFLFESERSRSPESVRSYQSGRRELLASPSPSDLLSPREAVARDPDDATSDDAATPERPTFTSPPHFGEERAARAPAPSFTDDADYKLSDMSAESVVWLAHKLGPVLTCQYLTRNLLKMLSLCYVGRDNMAACAPEPDDVDADAGADDGVAGDRSAANVVKCLVSIVDMYGTALITFQYLGHIGSVLASCRRRSSAALEAGAVAGLRLLARLLPRAEDEAIMQQLDTILKNIVHPAIRLVSSGAPLPTGAAARGALARSLARALRVLGARVGPEMTRRHLLVPTYMRFFLIFDIAVGKTEHLSSAESESSSESKSSGAPPSEGFLELCRDGSTAEWSVRGGRVLRADCPSPPAPPPLPSRQAQEEIASVFTAALCAGAYRPLARLAGAEAAERALRNADTVRALCERHDAALAGSPQSDRRPRLLSLNDDAAPRKSVDIQTPRSEHSEYASSRNSFGSSVTVVGNRIDVADAHAPPPRAEPAPSDRHLRGDWLIYWEHETGRPHQHSRFNLKQIKLQTFVGHTQAVKTLHCLDNEHSFMSGSKDKTVKLWSLRNQGDGTATTGCSWSYNGHRKGVLSLSYMESQRLAVSTDSVVHIWDPFMESVVTQLDHIKTPISVVRAAGGAAPVLLAATTDATVKVIDARAPHASLDLKTSPAPPTTSTSSIRCLAAGARWAACGLASGHVVVLDTRAARAPLVWRAHGTEVLRIAVVDDKRLLTSGLDQTLALWNVDDGELIAHLKGTTEPVHCLCVCDGAVITGSTANRIGVHAALAADAAYCGTRLRADTFRGLLACMAALPMNRLLLLGSDNGTISLLC